MRRTVVRSLLCAAACLLPLNGAAVLLGATQNVQDQLAQARAATAKYHDPAVAAADGYINVGPNPAEGGFVEFVNIGSIDCNLDIRHPEALRYADSGQGLRLVAVEYGIPMACPGAPPEDFLPGVGDWEPESLAPDVWTKAVWLWSGNSIGGGH